MTNDALQGLHIINTRPKDQASNWSNILRSAGAFVTEMPALEIAQTDQNWIRNVLPIDQFCQIIFISANAIDYFFSTIADKVTVPKNILVSTIGKQTANCLKQYSIDALFPDIPDSEHLLAMPHLQHINKQKILLVKGIGGRRLIAQTLKTRGAFTKPVNTYKRRCPNPPNNLANVWKDRQEKIILVTSKAAIDNLFRMMPNFQNELQQATWLTLSKRLATYARSKQVKHIIISDGENLVRTLMLHQQGLAHDR